MQFVVIVLPSAKDPEFGLTIAAIPVTIVILILAGYFTRRENIFGMIATIVSLLALLAPCPRNCPANQIVYFAALAYFLFKLVRIYEPGFSQKYSPAAKSLTIFGVIAVILIVVTIVNACVCTNNFGRGLKPHVASRRVAEAEEKVIMSDIPSYTPQGAMPSRMTID